MTQLSRVERKKQEQKAKNKKVVGVIAAAGVTLSISSVLLNSVSAEKNEVAPIQKTSLETKIKDSVKVKSSNLNEPKVVNLNSGKETAIVTKNVPVVKETPVLQTEVKEKEVKVVEITKKVAPQSNVEQVSTNEISQQEEQNIPTEVETPVVIAENTTVEPTVVATNTNEVETIEETKTTNKVEDVKEAEVPVTSTQTIANDEPKTTEKTETVKEALGTLSGIVDTNAIEMDIEGNFDVFNAGGDVKLQKEISKLSSGTGLVVRYTVTPEGQKLIKDLVKVYDPIEGDLTEFVTVDFYGMVGPYTIAVFENNKETTYQLSEDLFGKDFEKEFAPGTKVSLALVKTDAGVVVESINEL